MDVQFWGWVVVVQSDLVFDLFVCYFLVVGDEFGDGMLECVKVFDVEVVFGEGEIGLGGGQY